jgi:hypothetical protein
MKTKKIAFGAMGISALATVTLMAGPLVTVQIGAPPPVAVQASVPPPVVTMEAVPDTYVWDGYEYVGVVGTQYYYLGTDHVWLTLDAPHMARFHDWQRDHADWRTHAIRNELYRRDAHGHDVPLRDNQSRDVSPANSHDKDHDHDH